MNGLLRQFTKIFLFTKGIETALKQTNEFSLKEDEKVEVHQVVNVGEFNNEKVFLIILNVIKDKG
ncbi:hypothetical protein [Mesobacillus foraminis]|uniref:hypothetical protein n=1 Tax=Mesobacillus foraminis TaxID=279826 RepID=UPI000EF4775E|nr:hypothetical protein [Mesobacillus foraminis]